MTFDLQILRGANREAPVTVAFADPPLALEGTGKAAQKFAFLFLREYDSVRDRGTLFPSLLKTGQLRTDASVALQFTAAVLKIIRQLGTQDELPPSEQILRADLIAHSVFSDTVTLTVRLTTTDGTTNFVLPIERLS